MWTDMYAGVDHSIPGNGGPECVNFLPGWQRVVETVLAVSMAAYEIKWAYPKLTYPTPPPTDCPSRLPTFERLRRWLVAFLCFVFGVEMGYKFASKTSLYVLNPCHVATIMQIALLCSNQRSRFSTALFRVHLYTLPGATLAIVLPVINTRLFPLEVFTYYVQHIGILSLPILLMATGGSFAPEPLTDMSWPLFSSGILMIYHFLPLQMIGMVTAVNLNNMICPAISDPFRGPWYRLAALVHQSIFVPLHGKLYGQVAVRLASYIRYQILVIFPYDDSAPNSSTSENGSVVKQHASWKKLPCELSCVSTGF